MSTYTFYLTTRGNASSYKINWSPVNVDAIRKPEPTKNAVIHSRKSPMNLKSKAIKAPSQIKSK